MHLQTSFGSRIKTCCASALNRILWHDIKMKRVLIFSLAYYPTFVGGAEVAIKEITDRIIDIEFHMITQRFDSTQPAEEKIGNVRVYRIGFGKKAATAAETYSLVFYISKILFIPLATWTAFRLHRRLQFDGAWAMMSYMLFPLVLLRFSGVRIPYALTLQEGDPFDHTYKRWYIYALSPLLRIGFHNAAVVQSISTFLSRWAVPFGFNGPREVIPNAVDTQAFAAAVTAEELIRVRSSIGKRDREVWLIHTGRLVHKNALDDIIRALALLSAHIHLFLLGDGPEKSALERLAQERGVSKRVHVHTYVPLKNILIFLKACDIFIRPSRSEGMGNSFVEAMAAGLPVIATQEGGISDFLFDERRNPDKPTTGWAVDKNSPEHIAEAVKDIIMRPEKVKEVVATAQSMVIKKYDWNIIARDMREKVFGRILG